VVHRSARFVAWSHAVRLGNASPDRAADEIAAGDPPHRVQGLPGDGQTLPVLLARLAPTTGPRLVLPATGDPRGLPGPGALTAAAISAGEAVLLPELPAGVLLGLVPVPESSRTTWQAYPFEPADLADTRPTGLPSLAEADRSLAESVREATELLTRLDLARLDDESAAALGALRAGALDGDGLAPGYPQRAYRVLALARRLRVIVALASRGDGAALTAAEAEARRRVLADLDRAARHAEAAAYNCPLEGAPDHPTGRSGG
jgi:hypothetical protein